MYIAGFFVTIWKHGRGGCRDSDVQIFLFRYLMKPVQKEHRKCLENSTSLTDTPPLSVVFNTVWCSLKYFMKYHPGRTYQSPMDAKN